MTSDAGDDTDKFETQGHDSKSLELLRQISRSQREGNERLERGQAELRDEVRQLAARVEFVTTRSAITVEKQAALESDIFDLRAKLEANKVKLDALATAEEVRKTATQQATAGIMPLVKNAFITAAVGLCVLVFGLAALVWAAKAITAFTPSAAVTGSPAAQGKLP